MVLCARSGPRLLAVLLLGAVLVLVSLGAQHDQTGHRSIDLLGGALIVGAALSLLALRRAPWFSLAASLAAAASWFAMDYPGGPVPLPFAIALVVTVVAGRRQLAWTAAGAALVIVWLALAVDDSGPGWPQTLAVTAWLLVLVTVGEQIRARREKAVEAVRARTEQAQRQASEERLRMARELHDVLAHNIALISVQAGVALHLMDSQPAQARNSLETIRDASRNTMQELRATVGALRQEGESAPLRPAPGLASLESLTVGVAAAGVKVRTTVTGDRRPLPAAVDLAAYRIVQEALTNVARHAATTTADVHVDYGADCLSLRVLDDGVGAGPVEPGNGLTGMQERATTLGGRLVAGPRREGGFAVEATLPVGP